MINRDEAIEALKKENESLEAERLHHVMEAKFLAATNGEAETFKKERDDLGGVVAALHKEIKGAEAVEKLAA